VIELQYDVRTLGEWGRAIGASRGSLRGWCHIAGVQPCHALAFARSLRAQALALRHRLAPEHFLEFSDKRTVGRFLGRGRSAEAGSAAPETLEAFCAAQTYLRNRLVVDEVIRLVRDAPPFSE
jgi:hypothetical protein